MERALAWLHVGTSGWTYGDWNGRFYPAEVTGAERLSWYATRFDTVEVNATFYRLPFKGMIMGWNRRLPARFHLVLKGPRSVTHLNWHDDFERLLSSAFLQPNVAPTLPHHNPAISLQCPDYLFVVQNRHLRHTAISTTSTSLLRRASSSTGSRYS